jgi:beta-galactosidase
MTARRDTTGLPAALVLRPDRATIAADGEDLTVITVEVVDAAGRVVPTADDLVTFAITGPGKLIGVGNGDPSSHEPDKASERHAFNGLCCAIVQATKSAGSLQITATAPGRATATIVVTATAATARPALA